MPSSLPERHSLSRFRWVIGTPYFVQGTSSLTEVPILYFIKHGPALGDAGRQALDSRLLRLHSWAIDHLPARYLASFLVLP